jgi:hypothetical protein
MQAVAAELTGYAGKFRCFFGDESLETVSIPLFSNGLLNRRGASFKSFLARNELVASVFA